MPGRIRPDAATMGPMLAVPGTLADAPPSRYAYEFKWDGIRALVAWDGRRLTVRSRNGRDLTPAFPELAPLGKELGRRPALLDGEIVALDAHGKPSFQLLQQRMGLSDVGVINRRVGETPTQLLLFDVLMLDGKDLTNHTYEQRRTALLELGLHGPAWSTPGHHADGDVVLEVSRRMGLEGIVAKRLDSPYTGTRSAAWVKVRNRMRQEFVVGGWTEGKAGRTGHVGSLVVGFYPGPARRAAKPAVSAKASASVKRSAASKAFSHPAPQLVCVGKVGSGLGGRMLGQLEQVLHELRTTASPFDGSADRLAGAIHFVRPALVCEVEFSEVTRDGLLRQPAFKGLRTDKDPRDVVWEQATKAAPQSIIRETTLKLANAKPRRSPSAQQAGQAATPTRPIRTKAARAAPPRKRT